MPYTQNTIVKVCHK